MEMPTSLLPRIRTWRGYRRIFARPGVWTRAARHIAARHGLKVKRFEATFPGTCGVLSARLSPRGTAIVKIFPPMVRRDRRIEEAALRRLGAMPGFPAPRLIAQGRLHDRSTWDYLILDPREGRPIRELRNRMSGAASAACAAQLGRLLRRLHSLSPSGLRFPVSRRMDSRAARKRAASAALRRLRRARIFSPRCDKEIAERLPGLIEPRAREKPVLVHGDVTEDHVLLKRRGGRWRLSGLIDFADALIAPPFYELMPLWFGAFDRKPSMLRRFLKAYSPAVRINRRFRDRATAFTLIHLFGADCIAWLSRKDRRDPGAMDWNSLRDWLWPSALKGGSGGGI